jgi:hypothetical protein
MSWQSAIAGCLPVRANQVTGKAQFIGLGITLGRRKMGFGAPPDEWFRGHSAIGLKICFRTNDCAKEAFLRRRLRDALRERLSGKDTRKYLIWDVLMSARALGITAGGAMTFRSLE